MKTVPTVACIIAIFLSGHLIFQHSTISLYLYNKAHIITSYLYPSIDLYLQYLQDRRVLQDSAISSGEDHNTIYSKRPGGRERTQRQNKKNREGNKHDKQQRMQDKLLKQNKSHHHTFPIFKDTSSYDRNSHNMDKSSSIWMSIPMPSKSYYAGIDAPSNNSRWKEAQLQAIRGDQILLHKMLQTIKSPFDYIHGTKTFKWIHELAEYHKSKDDGFLNDMIHVKRSSAPITMFGYRKFEHSTSEGNMIGLTYMSPGDIKKEKDFDILRKIVAIGNMDENWGYLSTYFLNRTVPWAMSLAKRGNPYQTPTFQYCDDYMKPILDHPNLVMLVVNQHHNCSHHKIISLPLGINDPRSMWNTIIDAHHAQVKKSQLFFTAGSNYAFRPFIRDCISKNMGEDMEVNKKMPSRAFRMKIVTSMAVLCMPGLGYDTYRLWETLGSGSLPVVERGFGMDRTFYKLPVLLVDDYADLNAFLIRQAYVEALYHVDEWEYERMTKHYWQRLIYEVSEASHIDPLLRQHPMSVNENFTRPLVPYDCDKLGGCGAGTKRTPKKYCAIDPSVMDSGYKWVWDHGIGDVK